MTNEDEEILEQSISLFEQGARLLKSLSPEGRKSTAEVLNDLEIKISELKEIENRSDVDPEWSSE